MFEKYKYRKFYMLCCLVGKHAGKTTEEFSYDFLKEVLKKYRNNLFGWTVCSSNESWPAEYHVGIQVHLTGDSRGVGKFEYKTGWVVVNNWFYRLYEFPAYQQTIKYDEQQVIAKGGLAVTIHPTFNYALKPGDVGDMFSNLRKPVGEIENGWLQTAIIGAVNDVANTWTVDSIFNHRQKFEGDILVEANKRISRWFQISQLRTNIVPPKSLQESIEQKTKAIQEVQVAENQRLVAVAEGDKRIATAKADSATAVIAASGKAEAIKKEQLSLTPLYIEYIKVQKWNGENSSTVLGSNASPMINVK